MSFDMPFGESNFMGKHTNAAAALAFIQGENWDTNKDGTGSPESGTTYYNTTINQLLYWNGSAWIDANTPMTLDIQGIGLTWLNADQVQIEIGLCKNDTNYNYINVVAPITVDITALGLNGLDVGVEAASTWYYIWIIKNPTTQAIGSLFSLSAVAPTMPAGFTEKRRIGSVYNNLLLNIPDFITTLKGNRRTLIWAAGPFVIFAGVAAVMTPISCSAGIPPTSTYGIFSLGGQWIANGFQIQFRRNGGGFTFIMIGYDNQSFTGIIPTDAAQNIEYMVVTPGAIAYAYVQGFEEDI